MSGFQETFAPLRNRNKEPEWGLRRDACGIHSLSRMRVRFDAATFFRERTRE